MKRLFSMFLILIMVLAIVPVVFATNDYTQGTLVQYVGQGAEEYTITVPALLKPGESGTVKLEGTWAFNRIVSVTSDPIVELTNNINSNDKKTLSVTFAGISEAGSNTGSQVFTEPVSVDFIENAIFGIWSGKFNYNVNITTAAIPAGLYETGSDWGVMIASWDELIEDEVVFVEDGILYTKYDDENWVNLSADALAGDLMLPQDGSITQLGDFSEETWEGRYAFYWCGNLTGIYIPEGVTKISDDAFNACNYLTKINIPTTLTHLGNAALGAIGAKEIELTEEHNLEYIGEYAFGSSKIENIYIPSSVTVFSDNAFYSCRQLQTAVFASDSPIKEIGPSTFSECPELTTVVLPENLEVIGGSAFWKCYKLSECKIPETVKTIGSSAFYDTALKEIIIPDSVTELGGQAFYWNQDTKTLHIGSGLTTIPANAFNSIGVETVVIPDNITSIGDSAFYSSYKMKSVVIPSSVQTIGKEVFARCSSLETVTIEENSQLTSIGENCFIYDAKLQSITIPKTVSTIGSSTFRGCKELKTVVFEDGSAMTRINSGLFRDCIALESIILPEGIGTIDSSAFYNCTSLTYVSLPSSTSYINGAIFYGCQDLTSINYRGTANRWKYVTKNNWYNSSGIMEVHCSDETVSAR